MPRFHETNDAGDPGFELTTGEVVARFWQSEEGEDWAKAAAAGEPVDRLDRVSSGWIHRKLGSTDRDSLDELLDAIYDGRPR